MQAFLFGVPPSMQNNDLSRVPTALGHLVPNLKEWNLRANRLPLKFEQASREDIVAGQG